MACKHVIQGILTTSLCVYVFCCCRVYVHMRDWEFCQWDFVFMFLLLYRVCTYVRQGILEMSCDNFFWYMFSNLLLRLYFSIYLSLYLYIYINLFLSISNTLCIFIYTPLSIPLSTHTHIPHERPRLFSTSLCVLC